MTVKIIKCSEPTTRCFTNTIIQEGLGTINSLEETIRSRHKSIILGEIIRVVSVECLYVLILIREVLPSCEYGQTFKAVIRGLVASHLNKLYPVPGDWVAFFEPFVFLNPASQILGSTTLSQKYILEIGLQLNSLLWLSKKEWTFEKISPKKAVLDNILPEMQRKAMKNSCSNRNVLLVHSHKEIASDNHKQQKVMPIQSPVHQVINVVETIRHDDNKGITESPNSRPKPNIQLPVNPLIPYHTQRLNPRYNYKSLDDIKTQALHFNNLERVNTFGVVHQIIKSVQCTSSGKFTIICKIIDESNDSQMDLHFFTVEDTLINQIEQGDVLRLHRIKMELYKKIADGRIFNSHDVLLFKKNSLETTPVTTAKSFVLTDEEKERVKALKVWYKDYLWKEISECQLLGDICENRPCCIFCQVVSKPELEDSLLIFKVTDGSVIRDLSPALHFQEDSNNEDSAEPTVTTIEVFNEVITPFNSLKVGDFIFLRDVEVMKHDKLQLCIKTMQYPVVISPDIAKLLEVKRRNYAGDRRYKIFGSSMETIDEEVIFEKSLNVHKISLQAQTETSFCEETVPPQTQICLSNSEVIRSRDCRNNSNEIEVEYESKNIQGPPHKPKTTSTDSFNQKNKITESNNDETSQEKHNKTSNPVSHLDSCFIKRINSKGFSQNNNHRMLDDSCSKNNNLLCLGNNIRSLEKEGKFISLENKASIKKRISIKEKRIDERSSLENIGSKPRKQLFTVNYGDLSDATDEASEIMDTLTQFNTDSVKSQSELIVTPGNIVTSSNMSFGELMEVVKTKYCSPRTLTTQDSPKSNQEMTLRSASKTENVRNKATKESEKIDSAVVNIVKLTAKDCEKLDSEPVTQAKTVEKVLGFKKRHLGETKMEGVENMDDDSTVINMSLDKQKERSSRKRTRLESASTILGVDAKQGMDDFTLVSSLEKLKSDKVSDWLLNSSGRDQSQVETDDLDLSTVKRFLLSSKPDMDISCCLSSMTKRIQVLLIEVMPEPSKQPLDLVSGYCFSGCQQIFLFTNLHWQYNSEAKIPLCPDCIQINQDKELELMFMLELHVMDTFGQHATLIVIREHAEIFLNCSVEDFVKDKTIRQSRVKLLTDYTVVNSLPLGYTPFLDVSVAVLGRVLCVVNSTLKLPSSL